jgi:hypothetical protein
MNKPPQQPGQIQVDIDAKDADGTYSNLAFLHLSASEFILDFARIMPGTPRAKVHSRIILTPQAAKAVLRLLDDNVKRFEAQHGEIRNLRGPGQSPIGFQPAEDPSSGPASPS